MDDGRIISLSCLAYRDHSEEKKSSRVLFLVELR